MQDQTTAVMRFVGPASELSSLTVEARVNGNLSRVAWEPSGDESIFAECSTGGTMRVWNVSGQLLTRREAGANFECSALAVSPGARYVAMGSADGRALLVDTGNELTPVVLAEGGARVTDLSFEPGLKQLAMVRSNLETKVTSLAIKGLISFPSARNPFMSQPETPQLAPPASSTEPTVVATPARKERAKAGDPPRTDRGPADTPAMPTRSGTPNPTTKKPGKTQINWKQTGRSALPASPDSTSLQLETASQERNIPIPSTFSKYSGGSMAGQMASSRPTPEQTLSPSQNTPGLRAEEAGQERISPNPENSSTDVGVSSPAADTMPAEQKTRAGRTEKQALPFSPNSPSPRAEETVRQLDSVSSAIFSKYDEGAARPADATAVEPSAPSPRRPDREKRKN